MPRVWIGIGSNQDRTRSLCGALAALRTCYGHLIISTVYASPPLGFEGAPFYNLVVGLDTPDLPQTIVANLHTIEEAFGRVRGDAKFAPRTLDLDLLTWGLQVFQQNGILLPRDEIVRYAFVLCPLAEVAGTELHPVLGQTYQSLWENFDQASHPLSPVKLDCS